MPSKMLRGDLLVRVQPGSDAIPRLQRKHTLRSRARAKKHNSDVTVTVTVTAPENELRPLRPLFPLPGPSERAHVEC